jgi:hypothetical protein
VRPADVGQISALLLNLIVASLLPALAVWELRAPGVELAARAA